MKSNIKEVSDFTRYTIMAILGIIFAIAFCATPANGQSTPTQTEKEWVETVAVDLPEGLEVFSGVTRNGNAKYWVIIDDIKVFLSPTNKEHYINETATILLVEWYNKSTDRYKYTTRQKKQTKQSKRINLEKI